jgi:hypothetical protein
MKETLLRHPLYKPSSGIKLCLPFLLVCAHSQSVIPRKIALLLPISLREGAWLVRTGLVSLNRSFTLLASLPSVRLYELLVVHLSVCSETLAAFNLVHTRECHMPGASPSRPRTCTEQTLLWRFCSYKELANLVRPVSVCISIELSALRSPKWSLSNLFIRWYALGDNNLTTGWVVGLVRSFSVPLST